MRGRDRLLGGTSPPSSTPLYKNNNNNQSIQLPRSWVPIHFMFTDRSSITKLYTDINTENKLAIPKPRINYLKDSFSYSGAVLWNGLPVADRLTIPILLENPESRPICYRDRKNIDFDSCWHFRQILIKENECRILNSDVPKNWRNCKKLTEDFRQNCCIRTPEMKFQSL